VLYQAIGILQGELQEFSHYLSLLIIAVRRFSIVLICSNRLFIIFLIPVHSWFADEIGLCVALPLFLWEHKNFVWLFKHMLLLVECIWFV
jgi:hypothetical protein